MNVSLEEAIGKLDSALGMLEAAVNRRIAVDHARADLETELQIMQDDRARLAVELDSASNRLGSVEAATQDVSRRVARAIATIEEVLAHQEPEPGDQGLR
jgi:predicted  nucleic acid-binding Zn-ribbon protein